MKGLIENYLNAKESKEQNGQKFSDKTPMQIAKEK